jgi:PAS domain S-box-containing protein
VTHLQSIGGDVEIALESINVPSYVIDRTGVVRWLNDAACRLVGDVRGKQFTSVVAPEETRRSREAFARSFAGPPAPRDSQVVVLDADGDRVGVELSAVPLLRGDRVIGVFGVVTDVDETPPHPAHPELTPRQTEVLGLLERGHSTHRIAAELHVSVETVRNHIRNILNALGVHSRLEAVALSRTRDLVPG